MRELEILWQDAPRYGSAAPFPHTRFIPGLHPHPRRDPRGSLYGVAAYAPGRPAEEWRQDHSYLRGVDLYHAGYLWESHEAWEACFDAAHDFVQRDGLQALIQLAAALLQEHRGFVHGAARLARSSARRWERVTHSLPTGARWAGADPREILTQLRAHFDAGAPAPRIRLH